MQLRQIQVAHDTVQDRLILRVATQANEEFRIFLTRRFLRKLWPRLVDLVAAPLIVPAMDSSPEAADSSANATFDEPFRDADSSFPLGSTPLLASECQLTKHSDGALHLTFREARERSFNLVLDAGLLQALCAMLRAAVDKASWDLTLDYGSTAPAAETPVPPLTGGPEKHGLLH